MKKIALLSCADVDETHVDEKLLVKAFRDMGLHVSMPVWSTPHDWGQYDSVIIRTTWDYAHKSEEFLKALAAIAAKTQLFNPLELVQWNIHKKYLLDLASKGVSIVPTIMLKHNETVSLPSDWTHETFIMKPAVSASAFKTFIIGKKDLLEGNYPLELHAGDWLIQPFIEEIKNGETSLHFFAGEFSHAVLKVPKSGDFRVQEEFGGDFRTHEASASLVQLGKKICDSIPFPWLFARVDLVNYQGQYLLMELELIEPTLNFRKDSQAALKFVKAYEKMKKTTTRT